MTTRKTAWIVFVYWPAHWALMACLFVVVIVGSPVMWAINRLEDLNDE